MSSGRKVSEKGVGRPGPGGEEECKVVPDVQTWGAAETYKIPMRNGSFREWNHEKRIVSNIRLETVNYKCFIGIFEKLSHVSVDLCQMVCL